MNEKKLSKSEKKYLINLIRNNRVNGNGYHRKIIGQLTMLGLYSERQEAINAEIGLYKLADKLEGEDSE